MAPIFRRDFRPPPARAGAYAGQIAALFAAAARRHGLDRPLPAPNAGAFRRPARPDERLRLL